MFSTRFKDDLRYSVMCVTNKMKVSIIDAVVDTGAYYTCFQAKLVAPLLEEKDFGGYKCKNFGGFVDGKNSKVRFYQYSLNQFTIGNIDMGPRDIWVTFDRRISDNILGMDILQSINFLQYNDTGELFFFKDRKEMIEYIKPRNED